MKEIRFVIKSFCIKNILGSDIFIGEFYLIFEVEIILILYFFRKLFVGEVILCLVLS